MKSLKKIGKTATKFGRRLSSAGDVFSKGLVNQPKEKCHYEAKVLLESPSGKIKEHTVQIYTTASPRAAYSELASQNDVIEIIYFIERS